MKVQAPKGTRDILPGDVHKWQYIEKITADLNLNPEQVTKVEAAIREFFMEKKQMKQGGDKDGLRESKQDFKDDILNALTPAQQQKFMDNIQTYKQLLKR